jgi:hypothetical protein
MKLVKYANGVVPIAKVIILKPTKYLQTNSRDEK